MKILIIAILVISGTARAASCDSNLIEANKISTGFYKFKFEISMNSCKFNLCAVQVHYKTKYQQSNTKNIREQKHIAGTKMLSNGKHIIEDEVSVGDSRYSPHVLNLEITETSCP